MSSGEGLVKGGVSDGLSTQLRYQIDISINGARHDMCNRVIVVVMGACCVGIVGDRDRGLG